MTLYIYDLKANKIHKRKLGNGSYCYWVENGKLFVTDYYKHEQRVHKYDLSKYGSVKFWFE